MKNGKENRKIEQKIRRKGNIVWIKRKVIQRIEKYRRRIEINEKRIITKRKEH